MAEPGYAAATTRQIAVAAGVIVALQGLIGPLLPHAIAALLEPAAHLPVPSAADLRTRFLRGHAGNDAAHGSCSRSNTRCADARARTSCDAAAMLELRTHDPARASLVEAMCASRSLSHFAPQLLPALSAELDASSGVLRLVVGGGPRARLGRTFTHGIDPHAHALWTRVHPRYDPLAAVPPPRAGRTQVFPAQERVDDAQLQRSVAYREFLEPNGLHHALVIRVGLTEDRGYALVVHRGGEGRPFTSREVQHVLPLLGALGATLVRLDAVERGPGALAGLTGRQREIAADVAAGLSNKEIASRRAITVRTVENHLRTIFARTGVDSRTQLALRATGDLP